MSPLLQVKELSLERYGEAVFPPVSLQVERGRCVLVVGANGAGKTTLLRLLAGLLTPSSGQRTGQIPDNGEDAHENPSGRIVWLGHSLALKGDLSVQENLAFMADFHGFSGPRDELLSDLRLSHRRHALVRELSAGQRKRLSMSRLMLQPRADLWLLDEPTVNLDSDGVTLLDKLLTRHCQAGGGAVIATHGAFRPTQVLTDVVEIGQC